MAIPNRAEVVVIGGGALGTSAAFHLADAGHRDVVLLDRGPIASGTTPQAAGQTGHLRNDGSAAEFAAYCIDFFENFEAKTGYAIDFRQCGSLRIALTEKFFDDLQTRYDVAHGTGQQAELITTKRARQMVPTLTLSESAGILFIPRDGYVEPKSVAVAFAAAARDRGVTIATHTPVTSVRVDGGKVVAVDTASGQIATDWVVLATGAWTRHLGRQFGLDLPVVPVRHQAFATAPVSGVSAEQPIVRITEPQLYVRHHEGGLLVGGYGYRPMSFEMSTLADDFQMASLEADRVYYEQLTEAAVGFFPALSDAVVVRELRGLPTMAPDAKPMVGQLADVSGLIVASACCVGGIHNAPGIGRLVEQIVAGQATGDWAGALDVNRFGDTYKEDAKLRACCEESYARMYQGTL